MTPMTPTGPLRPSEIRRPAVAGRFYPGDARELDTEVRAFVGDATGARPRLGLVAPHAGYVYSGATAGKVYAAVEVPEHVVVLAPNHTGRGRRRALWPGGGLALPGAVVAADVEVGERLLEAELVEADAEAHRYEHAVEVQLPFLRLRNPAVRVSAIVLGPLAAGDCLRLGRALAETLPPGALVVASSDMNHYLPDEVTRERDRRALAPLCELDAERLYRVVVEEDHSMCGFIPATVMLAFARARGATHAELVAYATSGDAFGDRDRVVGYAGVVVN